ncbi:unnamed protein product, partial [Darwinula stevensoni]
MKINHRQKTKIVATVGPASSSYENLLALARAGVNVFRLNFSHGSHHDHQQVIDHISYINEKYHLYLSILADLQGPKLRVGKIENNEMPLAQGDILTFVNEKCIGNKERIYMSYNQFSTDVKPGEKVLVDDGKVVLEVVETNKKDTVKLKVLHGSVLSSNKGVNLPDTNVSLPALTEKDLEDLDFILTQPIHWIALSFVRSSKDLKDLRERIDAKGHPAKIIAKIEKPEAIEKIDKIIKHANAIMVARGDLGIETPMERLPLIQKMIIKKCIQRARPVIVATQMMDSMITNPSPTRAEITDVANAVLDGADAVMLSGETSVGLHPVRVVEAMSSIIEEAEKHYDVQSKRPMASDKSKTFLSDVICFSAARTAEEINAKAIVGMTSSGYTAFKVSSYRPNCEIFMFSDRPHMLSTMNLIWGVRCFYYDRFTTTDETIEDVVEILQKSDVIKLGDIITMTTNPLDILRQYWGYPAFRPLQAEIIQSVLDNNDTLALLPTGGGKSLCFQVPALCREGICIVVSPLIALMKDQVYHLRARGIAAEAIYSGMHYKDIDRILDNAVYGQLKFLYLSPERLTTDLARERIKRMKVNLLAVDEAHCISQWGYDFRPSYLQIAELREFLPQVPILALTATATKTVVIDIQEKLLFRKNNVLQKSFARPNLTYLVLNEETKETKLIDILKKVPGTSVVYARNRRKTKELALILQKEGISADFYHAGLSNEERSEKQNGWTSGKIRVIVSTNA